MDVYIARQPIFNKYKMVLEYELLYRSSERNMFDPVMNKDQATRTVVAEAILNFGMESLTGNKKGYVNFTETLLLNDFPLLLDPGRFVLEVLENVSLSDSVIEKLMEYRERGYTIALDDYCGEPLEQRELDCMDIIKLDFSLTDRNTRRKIARKMKKADKCLLAEKIETEEQFQEAVKIGCELFQGYYFSRPLMLKKQQKNVAQITAARLIRRLSDEYMNMQELANIIRVDAHLTYKLLHKMRTVQYYRGNAVSSLREALVRMGTQEIHRWMLLVLVQEVTGTDEEEQIRRALVRAAFCEKLVVQMKKKKSANDAFITGLFSVLDRSDEELPKLLSELDLSDRVYKALLGQENYLNHCLNIVLYYEAGEWENMFAICSDEELSLLAKLYKESVIYAERALKDR